MKFQPGDRVFSDIMPRRYGVVSEQYYYPYWGCEMVLVRWYRNIQATGNATVTISYPYQLQLSALSLLPPGAV